MNYAMEKLEKKYFKIKLEWVYAYRLHRQWVIIQLIRYTVALVVWCTDTHTQHPVTLILSRSRAWTRMFLTSFIIQYLIDMRIWWDLSVYVWCVLKRLMPDRICSMIVSVIVPAFIKTKTNKQTHTRSTIHM